MKCKKLNKQAEEAWKKKIIISFYFPKTPNNQPLRNMDINCKIK